MKFNLKSLSTVVAFAVAAASVHANLGTSYDLIIGFSDAPVGATNDVVFNVGNLNNFRNPGVYVLGNFTGILNTTFGTDWSNVTWAGVGASRFSAGGIAFLTSKWTNNTGALGLPDSVVFGVVPSLTINTDLRSIGSFYSSGNFGALLQQLPYQVQNKIGNLGGPDFSASDLYALQANVDTSLPSQFLGTLAVYQNGEITFTVIPEPSTYAVIFGTLAIGYVAFRRRFSKIV
jgi:hypothetical protein